MPELGGMRAQAAAAELGWPRRLNMALEAAKGMLYLHSRAAVVLHRDLKSANLLVDKHWRVKVADFNLSRVMHASAVVSSVSATNPRCQFFTPQEVMRPPVKRACALHRRCSLKVGWQAALVGCHPPSRALPAAHRKHGCGW